MCHLCDSKCENWAKQSEKLKIWWKIDENCKKKEKNDEKAIIIIVGFKNVKKCKKT